MVDAMVEHILRLKVRAWGCKIKTNVDVNLFINERNLIQGTSPEVKIHFDFDPDDLPAKLDIDLEQPITTGAYEPPFSLLEALKVEIKEPSFDVLVPLKYKSGEPGDYRLEMNFRHAEYGTELAMVQPVIFKLLSPAIEIRHCTPSNSRVSKGQEVQIKVGLYFPAPQKIRGLIFGRLISSGKLINSLYELEPKRISFQDEKEIIWNIKIPPNETETGTLTGVLEFKSKDAITKKEFADILEIRQDQLLNISSITSSKKILSANDEVEINLQLSNSGLNPLTIELVPKIIVKPESIAKSAKKNLMELDYSLPIKKIDLAVDDQKTESYTWLLPEDIIEGLYNFKLNIRNLETGNLEKINQFIFEVRKHHIIEITDAFVRPNKFQPGGEGAVNILISDTGTRVNKELAVNCRIYDIFNQEIFSNTLKMGFTETGTEFSFVWPVPDNLEAGKYDLIVEVFHNDNLLKKRKFGQIINIENPVKFELHLFLPTAAESDVGSDLSKFFLENEKIVKKIVYNDLEIYWLNSNTHIFSINKEPIIYSPDNKSPKENLNKFIEQYFSYLFCQEFVEKKYLDKELKYWSKLGYCWTNLVLMDDKIKKGPGFRDLGLSDKQKLSLSAWAPVARGIFQNTIGADISEKKDLSNIFQGTLLKNTVISTSDDFKLLSSIFKLIFEDGLRFSPTFINSLKKIGKENYKNLNVLRKLNSILQFGTKFKSVKNSEKLEKKFGRVLNSLISNLKPGHVKRTTLVKKFEELISFYSFFQLYFVTEIKKQIHRFKKDTLVIPTDLNNFLMIVIIYYFTLINFYICRFKFDQFMTSDEVTGLTSEITHAAGEMKKTVRQYWRLHNRWQDRYTSYLKNSSNRATLGFIHDHVKITTNPIIIESMRGAPGKGKLIFGNNGTRTVSLNALVALPSNHWSLVEPEAQIINNLYKLDRINISSKQTKELQITISFPNSLSFQAYKGILKLKPKPIDLLPELN